MRFACFYEIQHNTAEEKKGRLSNPILDDMKTEAVKQTNYVKSMVTAQGKMDQERKVSKAVPPKTGCLIPTAVSAWQKGVFLNSPFSALTAKQTVPNDC